MPRSGTASSASIARTISCVPCGPGGPTHRRGACHRRKDEVAIGIRAWRGPARTSGRGRNAPAGASRALGHVSAQVEQRGERPRRRGATRSPWRRAASRRGRRLAVVCGAVVSSSARTMLSSICYARLADVAQPPRGSFRGTSPGAGARRGGVAAGSARPVGLLSSAPRQRRRDDLRPVEGAPARQHLVQHGTERPDVGALVDGLPARLLRAPCRRPCRESCRARRHRGRRERRRLRDDPRAEPAPGSIAFASPKSSTFTVPSGRDLDVRGLQVAVDDALLVRGFERLGDLPRDRQRLVERDRAAARSAARDRRPRRAP